MFTIIFYAGECLDWSVQFPHLLEPVFKKIPHIIQRIVFKKMIILFFDFYFISAMSFRKSTNGRLNGRNPASAVVCAIIGLA